MPCHPITINGARGFVCVRGGPGSRSRCSVDGCRGAVAFECDFEVDRSRSGKPKTCDAKLCDRHAAEVGPDRHHCPRHVAAVPMLKDLFE